MWVTTTALCLVAFVAGIQADCTDFLAHCDRLEDQFCQAPYDVLAKEVCAKRCGLCDDNSSMNKRSHNHGPDWLDHCWDQSSSHIQDPFCAMLTTTTTTTTTTTPKPTTTPTTTTTTTEPTTTTTIPTTTTTEPTTTTPEPTTTTTPLPPTTTMRTCRYEAYNNTDIRDTDFGTDMTLIQNANITLNESVHLIGDVDFCSGVCAQSLLNDGYECWAFTFNDEDKCYLYYYNRPLYMFEESLDVTTTLYLKRCSDDPPTTIPPATEAPATTVTEPEPVTNNEQTTTPMEPDTTTTQEATTMEPVATDKPTKAPAVDQTTKASTGGGPDTSKHPGGIVQISATSFQINGVPSPLPNTCYFLNTTWNLGEHWKDTCRYDCECRDTNTNTALCSDICPVYTSRPSNCNLVSVDGQCCPVLDCANNTDINGTSVGGSGDGEDCDDTIGLCDYYPDSACVEPYEPWARAHCALRCGYCDRPQPCEDRITFCDRYDLDSACIDYSGWARYYCKKACAICS